MRMNPGIIMAGQAPDIVGGMQRGAQLAQFENDAGHTNALRSMLQQQGPGIMAGEQNALADLARFDPQAALGVQSTRQTMAQNEQRMQLAYQEASRAAQSFASRMSADQREQEAATLNRGLAMLTQAQTPEQFAQIMALPGVGDAVDQVFGPGLGTFENRDLLIAGTLGLRDALTMGQGGQTFRGATPEEAARYGAAGGQFGPDGRFYPINPPSGMTVETTPEGGVRMVQGAGVGGQSPRFTEAQGRDNVYSTRARGALESFEPVANALMSRPEIIAGAAPMGLGRGLQTPEYQQAEVSGMEFLQAILRKDTGAAITTQEREEYGRVYLPQPGDTPQVLEMRRQARARAIAALESGMTQEQIAAQTRALAADISRAPSQSQPQGGQPRVDMAPSQAPATPPSAQGQMAPIPAEAAQAGVTPELWSVMTPEERAVFE